MERKDQAILVVSFGTSYGASREAAIGGIERAMAASFPDYEVRRAFTSRKIIRKLKERDGLFVDDVKAALERALEDGIGRLVVQPTHLMGGFEYTALKEALHGYEESFEKLVLGAPLLWEAKDHERVAEAVIQATKSYADGETAICLMGHGTKAAANVVYKTFQEALYRAGAVDHHIGTVEAGLPLEEVIAAVKKAGRYKRVVLAPLMVVAGDHALNDMAGEKAGSWKSAFAAEGYKVRCILKGLGGLEEIQKIYVDHARAAMTRLAAPAMDIAGRSSHGYSRTLGHGYSRRQAVSGRRKGTGAEAAYFLSILNILI